MCARDLFLQNTSTHLSLPDKCGMTGGSLRRSESRFRKGWVTHQDTLANEGHSAGAVLNNNGPLMVLDFHVGI